MNSQSDTAARSGRKYSERLGVLEDRQFQAALKRFELGRFVKAEPITGGLFGQNVFVTSTKGEFVLRGCPHYDWQFPKELFIARFLHEQTDVQAPWPYLIDEGTDIFGWNYVLMPRMPGHAPVDAWYDALAQQDRDGISLAMGDCMARLQAPEGPSLGEYELKLNGISPLEEDYAEWCVDHIRKSMKHAQGHSDRTTEADAAWLETVIEKALPELRRPFRPTFVMQDFKRGNMTVQKTGNAWRVAGLFDLMEPYFGDGEIDFWRHLSDASDSETRAFLEGYLTRRAFRPGYAERMMLYMLADRLRIWSYGQ
jgi:hypothetical protein